MNTLETEKPATVTPEPVNRLFTSPRASVLSRDENTVIQLDLPGVARAGLTVTIEKQHLTVIGQREPVKTPGERLHGGINPVSYRRVFELTPNIDAARISADLRDGVLTLTLPTAEQARPRQISVS